MVDYSILQEIAPLLTEEQNEQLKTMIGEAQAAEGRFIGDRRYQEGYRYGYDRGVAKALDVFAP